MMGGLSIGLLFEIGTLDIAHAKYVHHMNVLRPRPRQEEVIVIRGRTWKMHVIVTRIPAHCWHVDPPPESHFAAHVFPWPHLEIFGNRQVLDPPLHRKAPLPR